MSAHSASAPTSQQATQTSTRRVLSRSSSPRLGDANQHASEGDAYGQSGHEQDTYGQETYDQEAQPQDDLAYRDDGAGCYPLNPVLLDTAGGAADDASLAIASGITSSAMVANVTAAEGSATGVAGIGPIPAGPANAAGAATPAVAASATGSPGSATANSIATAGAEHAFSALDLAVGSAVVLGGVAAVASGNSSGLGTLPSTSPVQPGAQGNLNTPSVIAQNGETGTALQNDNIRGNNPNGTVNGASDPDHTSTSSTGNSAAGTDASTSPASPSAGTSTLPANTETPPAAQPTPPAQTEAATGPPYATASQRTTVAHDQLSTLDSSLFTGTNPKHLPAYIRINRITRADGTEGDADLVLRPADGTGDVQPVQVGQEIALADLGRLAWNARSSQGGTLTFTPLNEDHQPYSGTEAQTLEIHESPTLPVYSETSLTMLVPHDGQGTLQQALEGTDDSQAPLMIRIGTIQETDDTDTEHSALYLQETGGTRDELHEGDTVSQAQFGDLRWDASQNAGGSFEFTPLESENQPLAGTTTQTVEVIESPQAPAYPSGGITLGSIHDIPSGLPADLFNGSDRQHQPPFVQITAIRPINQKAGDDMALMMEGDDDTITAVTAGQTIASALFDRMAWNSASNDGGSFDFVPLDQNKRPIAGVAPQTVQIHESPEAPTWTTDTTHLKLPLSGEFHFSEEIFTGTSTAHAPAFIRIASLTGANTAADAVAPTLELRKDDGSVTTVTMGDDGTVISREDFGRLHWNGHGNQGGTFLFEALDGDKFNIITSEGVLSEHRVQMEPGSSQITYIIESAPIGQPLLLDGLQHSVPALI